METEYCRFIAECSTYDFKRELDRKKKNTWLKSVSAFANTTGGSLYFGVDNDGQVLGLADAQSDAEFISETINAYLDPIPVFSINPQKGRNGKIFLDLNVAAGRQTPYYVNTDGRKMAYIRSGNESIPATSHQLFNLVLKGSNMSWDSLVTTVERSKHTFTFLEREFNERSGGRWEESLLESFGLVTGDWFLTNAGLLFADACPIKQSRVYCTRWAGLDKGDTINDAEFYGNILMNLRDCKAFIKANTAVPWFKLPDYRLNLPEYSERSIEEMCVNHLIHRDYTELGAEVAINIYDDRIETTSPGGIKESSDLERVDPSATVSYRRNPVIAEVFSQLKYMEKRGSGLKKIIEATSILPTYKEDRRPFFRSSRSFFFTTILNVNYGMDRAALESFADSRRPEPEYRPEEEIIISKTYPINQEPTQKTYPDSSGVTQKDYPENHSITQIDYPETSRVERKAICKTAQAIVDLLVSDSRLTRADLAKRIGKTEDTVKHHLKVLQIKGIIQRIGSDRSGYWKVLLKR